jgi:hypothetical protein
MNFDNKNLSGIKAELDVAYKGTRLLRRKLDELYAKRIEIYAIVLMLTMATIIAVIIFRGNAALVSVGVVLLVTFMSVLPLMKVADSVMFESMIQKVVSVPLQVKSSGGLGAQDPNLVSNESRLGRKARNYLSKQNLSASELEMFHILKVEWDDSLDKLIRTCKSI